jgi:hypothetical protein
LSQPAASSLSRDKTVPLFRHCRSQSLCAMPPFICNHQNLAAIHLTIKTSRRAAGAWDHHLLSPWAGNQSSRSLSGKTTILSRKWSPSCIPRVSFVICSKVWRMSACRKCDVNFGSDSFPGKPPRGFLISKVALGYHRDRWMGLMVAH